MVGQTGQIKAIKEHLEAGNTLTSKEAFEMFGCTRLSAQIFNLKKAGMNIKTEYVQVPTRYDTIVRVAGYYLDPDEINSTKN